MTDQATEQSAAPNASGPTEFDLARMFETEATQSGGQPKGQAQAVQGEEADEAESGASPDDVDGQLEQAEQSGEEYIEVPKLEGEGTERITRAELKNRMLMQADYTKKTQAVADERKALAAEKQKAMETFSQQAAALDHHLRSLAGVIKGVEAQTNWEALREVDPGAYLKAKEEQQARLQAFEQGLKVFEETKKRQRAERVAMNTQRLVEARPELLDPAQAKQFATVLAQGAQEHYGLTPQDLDAIDDHRIVLALADAAEFRRLKAKAAETKAQVSKAPQLASPGAPARRGNPESLHTHRAIQQAKKTGKTEDMAAAFERFLK